MENLLARLNGRTMPLSEVRVSPLDRGFLFGDAVYEVMRIYDGKPFLFEDHLKRLRRSLDCLRITGVDVASVRRDILELLAESGEREATVYLQVTRGVIPIRAHTFPTEAVTPTVFLFVTPYVDTVRELRLHGATAITQPDQRWGRVDIKTVNLLGNVLAAQSAKEAGVYEAILIDRDGMVTEGTHTNVFGVCRGVLRTKSKSNEILPGITRDFVLDLARELSIPIEERSLTHTELESAEEVFLTATTLEVFPVVKVDGRPVGRGEPGPVTVRLREVFAEKVRAFRGQVND